MSKKAITIVSIVVVIIVIVIGIGISIAKAPKVTNASVVVPPASAVALVRVTSVEEAVPAQVLYDRLNGVGRGVGKGAKVTGADVNLSGVVRSDCAVAL